ncbi:MAG TPA: hypothetical protein VE444_08315, partial [Gaiellaceae bacterium]|nr:hypothetical protein [Gaiellaceae bacterium]
METRARALIAAAALCAAGTAVAAVAFAAEAPRRAILVVAREDGLWRVRDDGRATLLPGTAGARTPSWAPSGREIAYERDGTAYAVNADGTGRRILLAGRDPDWSPDGRLVAVERDGVILVARRNGQGARRITSGPADRQPAWAPDGRRIAFSRDGVVSVVVVATGAVSAIARGADPSWSPDGGQVAFATDGGIATVRLDTGELRLHTVDGADGAPLFSPDGSEIGVVHAGNIIAFTPDGGVPRTIAPGLGADWASVPTSGEHLPDLDQRPPTNVAVAHVGGRYRIGFASAVDNVGRGPLWIRGLRNGSSMRARQL